MQRSPLALAGLGLLFLAAPSLQAQVSSEMVEAIQKEGIENSKVMEIEAGLTLDIGHRLTGSDNYTKACNWAMEEFRRMGLTNVHLEKWDTWPFAWNRGQWQGRIVEPMAMELHVATPAWTAGTPGLVRAPIFLAPTNAEELESMAGVLEGAYLFRESAGRGRRRGRQQDGEGMSEEELAAAAKAQAIREFQAGPLAEWVEENGIAGWVTNSTGDANYPNRIRVFGSRNGMSADNLPTIPNIVVRKDQAEQLLAMLKDGKEVVAEFDIRNRFRAEPIELHNVIADIPGTEKPGEYVIVGAHLDSWHQAQGATDNGTGSSSAMEAARILMAVGARPKRTIRFALWGGEEQGLLGSRGYVQRHRGEMENVSCVLNHDTGTNWAQNTSINAANYEVLSSILEPVMAMAAPDEDWDDPTFELRSVERLSGGGGSDHASFIAARVPAISWGLVGRVDYFGYTWHTQWDTYSVVVPEYQAHNATVFALTALGIANAEEKFSNEGVEPGRRGGGRNMRAILEGFLGLEFSSDNEMAIAKVSADSTASKAGFKNGDVITAVNGEEVGTLLEMIQAMRGSGGGRASLEGKVSVRRGEETVEIVIGG